MSNVSCLLTEKELAQGSRGAGEQGSGVGGTKKEAHAGHTCFGLGLSSVGSCFVALSPAKALLTFVPK